VKQKETIIECPCYRVCAGLGVKTSTWCRYRQSAAPPPGMHRFDPQETWCPGAVQANVLMLGYMLAGGAGETERLKPALDQVRAWTRELRKEPATYDPARSNES
jgi:hypothetical protein